MKAFHRRVTISKSDIQVKHKKVSCFKICQLIDTKVRTPATRIYWTYTTAAVVLTPLDSSMHLHASWEQMKLWHKHLPCFYSWFILPCCSLTPDFLPFGSFHPFKLQPKLSHRSPVGLYRPRRAQSRKWVTDKKHKRPSMETQPQSRLGGRLGGVRVWGSDCDCVCGPAR